MKTKIAYIAAFLLLCSLQVLAQKAKIEVPETIHDFGKVLEKGGKVRHIFEFRNDGDKPLTVSEVRASCGCTTPQWTTTPVPPKGTGIIVAEFNPKGRPGEFNKNLTIFSDSEISQMNITIKGDVVSELEMLADYTQFFGYNAKATDAESADFEKFVQTAAYRINTQDTAKVLIEASASFVPTKSYANNNDLANQRANDSKQRLTEALKAKGIAISRLKFAPHKALVQGPRYNNDYKEKEQEYGQYQYVKFSLQ
jgi:hypothetical protein